MCRLSAANTTTENRLHMSFSSALFKWHHCQNASRYFSFLSFSHLLPLLLLHFLNWVLPMFYIYIPFFLQCCATTIFSPSLYTAFNFLLSNNFPYFSFPPLFLMQPLVSVSQDDRMRTPLLKLKLAVCSVMPEQIAKYNMDCMAKVAK